MDRRNVALDKKDASKMRLNKTIKNIIFDLGGVLVDLDKQRCVQAFEQIGAVKVAEYVRNHLTADLFLEIETGQITTPEFCDEVRRMDRCTVTNDKIVWAWNQLLSGIICEKLHKLKQLKESYRLFLLSNTNDMHWQKCTNSFFVAPYFAPKEYFERVFLSYEMQLSKPDKAIFETVLQHANLLASETLFIDDSLENCLSAANLGIHVWHEITGNDWMIIG